MSDTIYKETFSDRGALFEVYRPLVFCPPCGEAAQRRSCGQCYCIYKTYLDVHLFTLKAQGGSDRNKRVVTYWLGDRGEYFVIVNAFFLCEVFRYLSPLVAGLLHIFFG